MQNDILDKVIVKPVYTTRMMVIASIFGGFYMGSYMMYKNFKTFGDHRKAAATILFTILAFVALIGSAFIPSREKIPGFFYVLLFSLAIAVLSKRFQGDQILQHVSSGGKLFSSGRALIMCLIGVLISVAIILAAMYLAEMGESPA
jgi:hypothetical protein